MNDRDMNDLVAAVCDGEVIDWTAALSRLPAEDRAVAAQLQALSDGGRATDRRTAANPDIHRRPRLLNVIGAVSIAKAATGIAAILLLTGLGGLEIRSAVALTFGSVALLLGLNRLDGRARALAGCYWTIAAAFAAFGVGQLTARLTGVPGAGVLEAVAPESFLAAFLWQFARDFPTVTRFSRFDRVAEVGLAVSLAIGVVLFLGNLLPAFAPPLFSGRWFEIVDRTLDAPGFWAAVFVAALPALIIIPLRARDAAPAERRRVRLFLSAIGIGLAPVTADILIELVPSVSRAMATPAATRIAAWLIYPSLLAIPIVTGYAVTVHRVFDLPLRVKDRMKRVLTHSLIGWVTLAAVVALVVRLYRQRAHPLSDVVAATDIRVLAVVAAIGAVLLVFRATLRRTFQRWTLQDETGRSARLASLTLELRLTRTVNEIADAFANAAAQALRAPATPYRLGMNGRLDPIRMADVRGPVESLIPILLGGARKPCLVAPGADSGGRLLSVEDRRWIREHQIAVLVPLAVPRQSATLSAVIAVHDRPDGTAFSREDVRFLTTASASASLALDGIVGDVTRGDASLQELAQQCADCGRIEEWSSAAAPCACGGAWERAALPKTVLDRFVLETRLGAGGMGLVYRATDRTLHRTIALKTLPQMSAAAADRLMDEARAMAAVCHQHIAVLYEMELWNGTPMLVMEYLPRGTLDVRLRAGPLPADQTVATGLALATALEHVHQTGRYHGDIKPSNIGFTADGAPKFLDFGLSRALAESAPLGGTVPYLSPEALRHGVVGPALDLWALSVSLFECVAGVHPFLDGASTPSRIMDGFDAAAPALRARLPRAFAAFFDATLARRPERRPQTASEWFQQLSALDVAFRQEAL